MHRFLVGTALVAAALGTTARPASDDAAPSLVPIAPAHAGVPRLVASPSIEARAKRPDPQFAIAQVRSGRSVELRRGPDGRPIGRLGSRTPFGSPTRLAVAARRGRWLGVVTSDMPNHRLAWVDSRSRAVAPARTRYALHVDLSRLRLTLLDGRHVVRRMAVGAGTPSSPTPTGRFAVTDKLSGARFSSSAYGCCIVALSGHQTRMPAGWRGGDRLAIHGGAVRTRSSGGCLHARERDLRLLMRRVPLGTPVFIRR